MERTNSVQHTFSLIFNVYGIVYFLMFRRIIFKVNFFFFLDLFFSFFFYFLFLQALANKGGVKRPGDSIDQPEPKKPLSMMQPQEGALTEQIFVPDNMVGLLIGRGGENITRSG